MNPWVPLAGTLAYNYARHLRGQSTICSTTRRALPKKWLAVTVVLLGFDALLVHYVNGYDIKIDLSDLEIL